MEQEGRSSAVVQMWLASSSLGSICSSGIAVVRRAPCPTRKSSTKFVPGNRHIASRVGERGEHLASLLGGVQ